MRVILSVALAAGLLGCQHQANSDFAANGEDELLQFAEANCFFWYFKKKGYAVDEIGGVTSGIVEMGSHGPEVYQQVAELVRDYQPPLSSKAEIDVDLLKCFHMEKDAQFIDSVHQAGR